MKLNNLINVVDNARRDFNVIPVDINHLVRYWRQKNISLNTIWICYDETPDEEYATTEGITVEIEYHTN